MFYNTPSGEHARRDYGMFAICSFALAFCDFNVFIFSDDVPRVLGQAEKHGVPVRPRHVPIVRRPHGLSRVSDLPQAGHATHPALLIRFLKHIFTTSTRKTIFIH